MGLDRTQNPKDLSCSRDFRDVMNIMALSRALETGVDTQEGLAKTINTVYSRTNRSNRGGAIDARDLSYHRGDERAKQSIIDIKDLPEEERCRKLLWYMSGQFDSTDPFEAKLNQ